MDPKLPDVFDYIKQTLIGPDILVFSMDVSQFVFDSDVSSDKIGTILSQVQNGVERVIVSGKGTHG